MSTNLGLMGRGTLLVAVLVALAFPGAAMASLSFSGPTPIDHDGANSLVAMACSSASECTAVGNSQEFTFDPASGAIVKTGVISLNLGAQAIACPSTTQCTAIDQSGDETTFDPLAPGVTHYFSLSDQDMGAIACSSAQQCTAVSESGAEETFNPTKPTAQVPTSIAGNYVKGIACPLANQCTVVDTQGTEVTFDPNSAGSPMSHSITGNSLTGVACSSGLQCTAIESGSEITFTPGSGAILGQGPLFGDALAFIACTLTQCVAEGDNQAAIFNPRSPGSPKPLTVDSSGPSGGVSGLACSSAAQCTVVDGLGHEITFDPSASATPKPVAIDTGVALTAVSCASASQCTAVDGEGQETTFSPGSPGTPRLLIDEPDFNEGGACTPAKNCAEPPFEGVSCPTATQCTGSSEVSSIVDPGDQQAVTFDPDSSSAPKFTQIGPDQVTLNGIACPSAGRCTIAVGGPSGFVGGTPGTIGEATFDPQTASSATPTADQPASENATDQWESVACPTTEQCTMIDHHGNVSTFDPGDPGTIKSTNITTGALSVIACPTSSHCTAVGAGDEWTFNPNAIGSPKAVSIDPGSDSDLTSIACPTVSFCVAVDASGDAIQGDPETGTWTLAPIPGAGELTAIACTSVSSCVTVNAYGDAFATVSRPVNSKPPKISGTARVGRRLSSTTGTWTGSTPITYRYQWQRCRGTTCASIAGATASSYKLVNADAGDKLRVIVLASNLGGSGVIVTAQYRTVQGLPTGSAKLSGLAPRKAKLGMGLGAGKDAPDLKQLVLTLPKGLSFKGSALKTALKINAPGTKKEKFSLKAHGAKLTIKLSKPAGKLKLSISSKGLSVTNVLAKAIKKHKTKKLTIHAGITDASHQTTTLTFNLKV